MVRFEKQCNYDWAPIEKIIKKWQYSLEIKKDVKYDKIDLYFLLVNYIIKNYYNIILVKWKSSVKWHDNC